MQRNKLPAPGPPQTQQLLTITIITSCSFCQEPRSGLATHEISDEVAVKLLSGVTVSSEDFAPAEILLPPSLMWRLSGVFNFCTLVSLHRFALDTAASGSVIESTPQATASMRYFLTFRNFFPHEPLPSSLLMIVLEDFTPGAHAHCSAPGGGRGTSSGNPASLRSLSRTGHTFIF